MYFHSWLGTHLKTFHSGKLGSCIHLNYEGNIQRPRVSRLDYHVGKIIVLVSVHRIRTFKKGENIAPISLLPYAVPGKLKCIREEGFGNSNPAASVNVFRAFMAKQDENTMLTLEMKGKNYLVCLIPEQKCL